MWSAMAERDRAAALRWTGVFAMRTVTVYLATTLAGSLLDGSYSQLRQPVSDLTATGANTWASLAPFYVLCNALAAAFAVGLYLASPRDRLWRFGLRLLLLNAICGVMMVTLFREDLGGEINTSTGAGHVIFAGISSLAIVIASFAFGFAFRRTAEWHRLARFSFAVGIGFALLGPVAAASTASKSDLAGLAERVTIGLFLVSLAVVGGFALRLSRDGIATRPATA